MSALARATTAGAAHRRAMIVKLERHANDFRAGFCGQRGDDATVHAAGHGNDNAPRVERLG